MKELTCDKCGGHNIKDEIIDFPNEKVEPTLMSEYQGINRLQACPAIMKCYKHLLTCLNCGFTSEYTN